MTICSRWSQSERDGISLPFSRQTLATLQHSLREVVIGEDATAKVVNFPDLTVAGKTGTAQNPHGENHSWFACYAPYEAPEIVVVALVENAGQGSEVAAPLCGEILRFYFGLPELAPFQAIMVTAAAPKAPQSLLDQLVDGGRLVIPVGGKYSQRLEVWRRRGTRFKHKTITAVAFVPLVGDEGWKEKDWKKFRPW